MSNWSNIRLIAVGRERDLNRLRRLAEPYLVEAAKPRLRDQHEHRAGTSPGCRSITAVQSHERAVAQDRFISAASKSPSDSRSSTSDHIRGSARPWSR